MPLTFFDGNANVDDDAHLDTALCDGCPRQNAAA
jgi:hypothetical protein